MSRWRWPRASTLLLLAAACSRQLPDADTPGAIAYVRQCGLCHDAHQPTLGGLVADATAAPSQILTGAAGIGDVWWLYTFPAAILVALLLAVTFLGDSLDEALGPMR